MTDIPFVALEALVTEHLHAKDISACSSSLLRRYDRSFLSQAPTLERAGAGANAPTRTARDRVPCVAPTPAGALQATH